MIKLIAIDMDGTLLNNNKEIDLRYYDFIESLQEQGILFCLASGRAMHNIINTYKKENENLILISDNGACIKNKQEYLTFSIAKNRWMKVADFCDKHKIAYSLNGIEKSFVSTECDKNYHKVLTSYNVNFEIVNKSQIDEEIVKITIYDEKGSEFLYSKLAIFNDELDVVISGNVWLDIVNRGVSKGSAVQKIMELYGIKKEEVVVFGDYHNDLSMFEKVKYSYAIKNAHEIVKQKAYAVCRYDNNNCGVLHQIEEILKKQ